MRDDCGSGGGPTGESCHSRRSSPLCARLQISPYACNDSPCMPLQQFWNPPLFSGALKFAPPSSPPLAPTPPLPPVGLPAQLFALPVHHQQLGAHDDHCRCLQERLCRAARLLPPGGGALQSSQRTGHLYQHGRGGTSAPHTQVFTHFTPPGGGRLVLSVQVSGEAVPPYRGGKRQRGSVQRIQHGVVGCGVQR